MAVTLNFDETFYLSEDIDGLSATYSATILPFDVGTAGPNSSWTRRYEPWPLQRDAIRVSLTQQVDALRLTLSNIGWDRHLGCLRTQNFHGKIVRIWLGFLDIAHTSANLGLLFEGEIDRIQYDEFAMSVLLKGNAKYLERDGLRRMYSVFCPFEFKSRECGYVGPDETCGLSYSDCQSKGNSAHFGGFNTLRLVQGTREII